MIAVRTYIFCQGEGIDLFASRVSAHQRRERRYIIGHCGAEWLIAFIIGYILIILRGGGGHDSVTWNSLIAPGLGIIAAIIIDRKFLIDPAKLTNGTSDHDKTEDPNKEVNNMKAVSPNVNVLSPHLPESLADDIDFRERIIESVNQMKDIQQVHDDNIGKLRERCDGIADVLDSMQRASRNQYGITLKKKMYSCLSKGYATPQEYDEIEVEYEIYHDLLGGNGPIERLHNNKFANLEVREDKRTSFTDPNDDKLCYYGEFDAEESGE